MHACSYSSIQTPSCPEQSNKGYSACIIAGIRCLSRVVHSPWALWPCTCGIELQQLCCRRWDLGSVSTHFWPSSPAGQANPRLIAVPACFASLAAQGHPQPPAFCPSRRRDASQGSNCLGVHKCPPTVLGLCFPFGGQLPHQRLIQAQPPESTGRKLPGRHCTTAVI